MSCQYLNEELVVSEYKNCDGNDVFFCDDDKTECISKDKLCNGVNECSTGRDENVEECGKQFVQGRYHDVQMQIKEEQI